MRRSLLGPSGQEPPSIHSLPCPRSASNSWVTFIPRSSIYFFSCLQQIVSREGAAGKISFSIIKVVTWRAVPATGLQGERVKVMFFARR